MADVANIRKLAQSLLDKSPGLFIKTEGGKVELTKDANDYDVILTILDGTTVEGSLLNTLNKFGVKLDLYNPEIAGWWNDVDYDGKSDQPTLVNVYTMLASDANEYFEKNDTQARKNTLLLLKITQKVLQDVTKEQYRTVELKREELENRRKRVDTITANIRKVLSDGTTDQQKFDLVVQEFNAFKDGFSEYVVESLKTGRDLRERLDAEFEEENSALASTIRAQGKIDNNKQVVAETQKMDLLEQSANVHLLKLNKHIIEQQSAFIGHLQDALIMTHAQFVKKLSVKEGPREWGKEADNLVGFMSEKVELLSLGVQKRFIVSSEFSDAVEAMYKDVNTALLDLVKRIMLTLNTMISKLTSPGLRERPVPVEPCFPYEAENGALSCWKRGTERSVLKAEFSRVNDADIQVVCCKKHKAELELVRGITITGYVMHKVDASRRVWVMNVKNGF